MIPKSGKKKAKELFRTKRKAIEAITNLNMDKGENPKG